MLREHRSRIPRVKNASALSRRRTTEEHRASSSVRSTPLLILSPLGVNSREKTQVYDVSNRESFEALPRWLEELENYVPPEVVKIVVGNKLDKVRVFFFRFLSC